MIPKKIHYCWFGGNPLPKEAKKCIESWKKYCPDYEIIEWNESNYDLNKNEYVKKAYEQKKYAFLTDYIRLDVIYEQGGIYLDTDVELIRNLDDLIENECYVGMEQPGRIATGLGFGAKKNHPFIKENKEYYENNTFWDEQGKFKKVICVEITTGILEKYGLKNTEELQFIKNPNVTVYPPEYLCPLKMGTNRLTITKNTYSIHHYDGSWKSNSKIIRKLNYYSIPLKQKIKSVIKQGKNIKNIKIKDIILNKDKIYLEKLVLIYFLINTLFKAIGFDSHNISYMIFFFLALIPLSIKIINTNYEKKELSFIIGSNIIGLLSFLASKSATLLITTLSLTAMKDVHLDKMLKYSLSIRIVAFIVVVFLAICGLIPNITVTMWRVGESVTRYALGFAHPNTLHLSLFLIFSLYSYIRYEKINKYELISMLIINIIINIFSRSRTGFALCCLLIVFMFIKDNKIIKQIINKSPKYILIGAIIFSYGLGLLYSKDNFVQKIDNLLNGRIRYTSYYLKNYETTMFGQSFKDDKNAILDNGYLIPYIQNGIVGALLLLYIIYKIILKYEKEKNSKINMLLCIFLIYLVTESFSPNIFMNIILLFYANILFDNKKHLEGE